MNVYLLALSVLMMSGTAVSLKCYACYEAAGTTDDPGLNALFGIFRGISDPPCAPDKTKSLTVDANGYSCATVIIDNWGFRTTAADGTVETGTLERFRKRGSMPFSIAHGDWEEGCYPASTFDAEYIRHVKQILGPGVDVELTTVGTVCLCQTGWCNDGNFVDEDGLM